MKFIKEKKEPDYSLFTAAAEAGITMDQMNALVTAQQGEEDAVYMYKQQIDMPVYIWENICNKGVNNA